MLSPWHIEFHHSQCSVKEHLQSHRLHITVYMLTTEQIPNPSSVVPLGQSLRVLL